MKKTIIPVILAGGKGERFWPLSRQKNPKQFLSLDGSGHSLLQSTAQRLLPLAENWDNLWVITSALISNGVKEQLPLLPDSNLLIEPVGKDTAPAVTWTCLEIAKRYGNDAIIAFFPADHYIENLESFEETIITAADFATKEKAIVTLGINPTYPSTGYGYIENGKIQGNFNNLPVYKVTRFTEKPDEKTAANFIKTGNFSWNSGMFIFRAGIVLAELAKYAPQIFNPLQEKGVSAYSELEKISIDYALMEKTDLAYVLPANFGWDDLGDWNSLERLIKGNNDNVEIGNHVSLNSKNNIIYAKNEDELIVTIGLEDVVIVREGNATLVVNKNRTQDIKKVLKLLQDNPKYQDLL